MAREIARSHLDEGGVCKSGVCNVVLAKQEDEGGVCKSGVCNVVLAKQEDEGGTCIPATLVYRWRLYVGTAGR